MQLLSLFKSQTKKQAQRQLPVATLVFADLADSSRMFERLGNTLATEVVTHATKWIAAVCSMQGGRLIKYLGDGVLLAFDDNDKAVHAAIAMLRQHHDRQPEGPLVQGLSIKVGMARGQVVEKDGDIYGDAVNIASRLSDLCGTDHFLASEDVVRSLPAGTDVQATNLGPMEIRGKHELQTIYRIEWHTDEGFAGVTAPAALEALRGLRETGSSAPRISLSSLGAKSSYPPGALPIVIGRSTDSNFVVSAQRVSRHHARIEWRNDVLLLEDLSSFGTWVRFPGSGRVLTLRRQSCVLLDGCELALGGPIDDYSVPSVLLSIEHRPDNA